MKKQDTLRNAANAGGIDRTQDKPSNEIIMSREDELLLSRYYDGECNFYERWRVRRLLLSNPRAEKYLDSLNEVGKQLSVYETSVVRDEEGNSIKVDLWERIEKRIEIEERAALFLGNRGLPISQPKSVFKFDFSKLAWGLTGSFATAAMVFVSLGQGWIKNPTAAGNADLFEGIQIADGNVDIDSSAMVKREISARPARRAIEVDWVRSDGRVHVIPDPSQRSAIIWVKRDRVPIFDVDRLRKKTDPARSDRPVIIEDNVPRSLVVAGPGGR